MTKIPPAIGYSQAKILMQHGWKARVTMNNLVLQRAEVFHPDTGETRTLRRDSAKKLIPECSVCGRETDRTAILCLDEGGSHDNRHE